LSTGKDRPVAAFNLYRQAGNRLSSSRVLLTQPTKVVPVTSKAKVSGNFEFSFAPNSFTVLVIQTK
jgi:hypothetical protein